MQFSECGGDEGMFLPTDGKKTDFPCNMLDG